MKNRFRSLIQVVFILNLFLISFAVPAQDSPDGLKIVVYGATGRVGSRVVQEALNRGHRVTAVSRDPEKISLRHQNLLIARGDVLDRDSVSALIKGQDVVVISVRGSVDQSKDPARTVHRMAAEIVVSVMQDLIDSSPRLIFVGGAGSLEIEPGVLYADKIPWLMRLVMPGNIRQEIDGHLLTLKYLRQFDDLPWTYISPAKKFSPGDRTGHYRIGGDQMLLDENGHSKISMEDYSVALVDEIENPQFIGQRFSVAY